MQLEILYRKLLTHLPRQTNSLIDMFTFSL